MSYWLLRSIGLGALVIFGFGGQSPTDLAGRPIAQLLRDGAPAVVVFFAASDCPISNRYIPEMQRLAKEFGPGGVRVWFVYPNPGDTSEVVRAHNAAYGIDARTGIGTGLDAAQTLVRMARATVTPEAAVFVPSGRELRLVYLGRVDDRYLSFGRERPRALHHDLEDALRAVVAGKPVAQAGGPPVGCSIVTVHP